MLRYGGKYSYFLSAQHKNNNGRLEKCIKIEITKNNCFILSDTSIHPFPSVFLSWQRSMSLYLDLLKSDIDGNIQFHFAVLTQKNYTLLQTSIKS